MNDKKEQKKTEKYIFDEFVKVCPLEIVSFESKDPSEPDIESYIEKKYWRFTI